MPAAAAPAATDTLVRLHVLAGRIAAGSINLNDLDDLAEASAELDRLLAEIDAA
jgi:hypothetical protein